MSVDVPELKQAVSAQLIASPHPYKKEYKEQIVGKGPHDPSIGYPEHDHHKKVGGLTSSVSGSLRQSVCKITKLEIFIALFTCF